MKLLTIMEKNNSFPKVCTHHWLLSHTLVTIAPTDGYGPSVGNKWADLYGVNGILEHLVSHSPHMAWTTQKPTPPVQVNPRADSSGQGLTGYVWGLYVTKMVSYLHKPRCFCSKKDPQCGGFNSYP